MEIFDNVNSKQEKNKHLASIVVRLIYYCLIKKRLIQLINVSSKFNVLSTGLEMCDKNLILLKKVFLKSEQYQNH